MFKRENLKPVVISLLLLGILALVLGVGWFAQTSLARENNAAYKAKQAQAAVAVPDESAAYALMSADMELRDIERNRYFAVILIGAGVILISAGWLGNDMLRPRKLPPVSSPTSTA